jgi:aminoglycoside phosphotransferase (APT) family kinase protein
MVKNPQIQEWWNENFPTEMLVSIENPSSGATTQTFILNRNKLLKVYISKDGSETKNNFFENTLRASEMLSGLDFYRPRVLCQSAESKVLKAPFICTKFIEGTDLSNILYKLSTAEQYENGKKIGAIIKNLHSLTTVKNQNYDTQNLLDLAKRALDFAFENNLLDGNMGEAMKKLVVEYKPRIIKTDFVLVHNDLHPENYLRDNLGKDFLIDFDMSFVGWKLFELRKLLYAALIPKYLVNEKLDDFYSDRSMIPFFKGLINIYPEIFNREYLDEIKLLLMPQGIHNLKKLTGSIDYDLTWSLLEMIFKEKILETI